MTFAATVQDDEVMLRVVDNVAGLDGDRDKDKVFGLFQRAHKVPAGQWNFALLCAADVAQAWW